MFTDILSSLACEHDGIEENSDIEEYDSDDSQSLFTKIKPANRVSREADDINNRNILEKAELDVNTEHSQVLKENLFGYLSGGVRKGDLKDCDKNVHNLQHSSTDRCDNSTDVIRDYDNKTEALEEEEDMESQSGPESDDSQSLISPPIARERSCAKAAQQKVQNCTGDNKTAEHVHSDNKNNMKVDEDELNENKNALVKGRKNTKLSLNRGKMPLSFLGGQNVKTPLNVSRNRKYRYTMQEMSSPITPLLNRNNFSPNIENAQNTSSPLTNVSSDFHYHIRSGMSPLTPGYNESYLENKSVLSDSSMLQSHDKRNVVPLSTSVQQGKGRRLSELDTIQEPKSNESVQSQWSEIDESDYMKLADESNIQRSGNISGVNESNDVANTSATLNTSSVKQKLPGLSSVHKHLNSFNQRNVSTSSQWSEVDEEQYMTLDLEDINRMTFSNQGNKLENNVERSLNSEKDTSDTSGTTRDKSSDHVRQNLNENMNLASPELFESESPPSPSILETTPIKTNRKRSHEACGSDGTEVSPLKRSLSQLKF